VIAVAAAFGAALLLRRRRPQAQERVDLYYDDGEVVTLTPSGPGGDDLFRIARDALSAAA
jgi:hypothetical protein